MRRWCLREGGSDGRNRQDLRREACWRRDYCGEAGRYAVAGWVVERDSGIHSGGIQAGDIQIVGGKKAVVASHIQRQTQHVILTPTARERIYTCHAGPRAADLKSARKLSPHPRVRGAAETRPRLLNWAGRHGFGIPERGGVF